MTLIYNTLKPGHFRLLKLLDNEGSRCELEEHPLTNAPPYYALSYAWRESAYLEDDRPDTDYAISVNGERLVIQKNLFYALSYLGSTIRADHERLWVDFLCINQANLKERSSQVRLMKDIFGNATQVLAWLGAPTDEHKVKEGVELIQNCSAWVNAYNDADREKWGDIDHRYTIQDDIAVQLPYYPNNENDTAWKGLEWVSAREFWQRTWIYQEVASEQTIFHAGKYSFTSKQFDNTGAILGVYDRRSDFEYKSTFTPIAPLENGRWMYRGDVDGTYASGLQRTSLLGLLRTLRTSFCTDARDKVFAPRGHATDMPDEEIAVDYSKNLVDVYIDVARYFLHGGGVGLEILGDVLAIKESRSSSRKDHEVLPSWVPDWDQDPQIEPLNNIQGNIADAYDIMYDPFPGSLVDARVVGHTLHMTTLLIDSLKFAVGPGFIGFEDLAVPREWREILRSNGAEFADDRFGRTLPMDAVGYWDETGSRRCKRGGFVDLSWGADADMKSNSDVECPSRMDIINTMCWACHKRSPGFTDAGRLGLFPHSAQHGDLVAAFSGGKALYVIRSIAGEESKYTFIGECYVDEMMDGQAVEYAASNNIVPKPVVLV